MKKDIAIIGMSGRFPKSENIETFWNNLVAEKELIHFFTDKELQERGVDAKKREQANFVKAASFVEGTDVFDYPLFKYTVNEAKIMNPQTRLMHELVWEALEDAACNVEEYNKKIGIFLGGNRDLAWSFHAAITKTENVDDMTKTKMSNPNFMASLISYKLNFKGPCYFIDTACSTSLSTAHLACRSLLLNECGIGVVGGVRLLSEHDNGYEHHEGSITSKDGHNKSFDNDSSGTVASDGAGVIILKRMEDAIKDNDHIYAVIRGSAMNNDGNDKGGYTMPSVNGQFECIKLAHKIAGVSYNEISYVEAHGTGTRIGDPIEIYALNKAFNNDTNHKCAIGTIKSNMGHADEAAGIAGLIKTALILKNRIIPASIHYKTPNVTIPFNEGPFYVNHTSTEWKPVDGAPLIAGVSSLGIGGTNVHVVLQEAPERLNNKKQIAYKLISYSANTEAALERYEMKLLKFLEHKKDINLEDLAYTLQVGRRSFDYGKSIVVKDKEELIKILKEGSVKSYAVKPKNKVVFMFSGQGSQYVNMGKQLYEEYPLFSEIMDSGFDLLRELKKIDYKRVLFNDSDTEKINETYYTQPILFLFEYALSQLLINFGIHPDYMIGHSLGEYVAATISGVFSLEDALRIVSARGELMASVEAGDMISVGAPLHTLNKSLINGVAIAAVNAPDSFVLSGSKHEIASIKKELSQNEISYIELKTSHAFHSKMMTVIIEDFKKVLNSVQLNKPEIPFISNLTGETITVQQATSPAYWSDHILGTVQFEKGIRQLIEMDHTLFIEVGPGRTLATFFKKSQGTLNNGALTTIPHSKEKAEDQWFLNNFLGNLRMHGINVNWKNYYGNNLPNKIAAPTYSFETYNVPSKIIIDNSSLARQDVNRGSRSIKDAFYLPSWKYMPAKPYLNSKFAIKENYLVFTDNSPFCNQLISSLRAMEKIVIEVCKGDIYNTSTPEKIVINHNETRDYGALLKQLKTVSFDFDFIVYAWDLNQERPSLTNADYTAYNQGFDSMMHIIKGLQLAEAAQPKKILFLSNQHYKVIGSENIPLFDQHVSTLLNVLSQENANLYTASIDIDLQHCSGENLAPVFAEFISPQKYAQVAFRNGRRWEPYYQLLQMENEHKMQVIKQGGIYLLTGQLDVMECELATHFITEFNAHVFLFSPEIDQQQQQRLIKKLGSLSGNISFIKADISNYDVCKKEVEQIEKNHGAINGIIHLAKDTSIAAVSLVSDITSEVIEQHFSPRVNGLITIDRIFKDRSVDFIKIISSLSSFLGGVSYGAYAAAAALMDNVALHARETKTNWSIINIDRVHPDEQWIQEHELISIFYNSFLYESQEQLIVSKRDLQHLNLNRPQQETKQVNVEMNRNQLKSTYQEPENETQKRLIDLFEELFGIEGIGVTDDFFELGGDSLKALVLINRLKKESGIVISISDMFANKTALEIAALIDEKKWLKEERNHVNELII